MIPGVEPEDEAVLVAVQAMLGLISPNIRAVAVEVEKKRIVLRFWVWEEDEETAEDIDDMVGEMEVLYDLENPPIETIVEVGPPPPDEPGQRWRMVYLAKET